jgi:hypothetical protein
MNLKRIEILGKSKRAIERIKQHGFEMILIREDIFQGKPSIFVRSTDTSWSGNRHWWGWFNKDEIEIIKCIENVRINNK